MWWIVSVFYFVIYMKGLLNNFTDGRQVGSERSFFGLKNGFVREIINDTDQNRKQSRAVSRNLTPNY